MFAGRRARIYDSRPRMMPPAFTLHAAARAKEDARAAAPVEEGTTPCPARASEVACRPGRASLILRLRERQPADDRIYDMTAVYAIFLSMRTSSTSQPTTREKSIYA